MHAADQHTSLPTATVRFRTCSVILCCPPASRSVTRSRIGACEPHRRLRLGRQPESVGKPWRFESAPRTTRGSQQGSVTFLICLLNCQIWAFR
jgi:hypothetical protein